MFRFKINNAFLLCIVFFVIFINSKAISLDSGTQYIRSEGNEKLIVFIHGFLGDSVSTWMYKDIFWPEMLSRDSSFSDADIMVYEYLSTLESRLSIDEISHHLISDLKSEGALDYREIIFIAHSMGGLITRKAISIDVDLAEKVNFIYFYATPSAGSGLASYSNWISKNPNLAQMSESDPNRFLAQLHADWITLIEKHPIQSYCAYEKRETGFVFRSIVVNELSAIALCTKRPVAIDEDHIQIVKPANIQSRSYTAFKNAYLEQSNTNDVNSNAPLVSFIKIPLDNNRKWKIQAINDGEDSLIVGQILHCMVNFIEGENKSIFEKDDGFLQSYFEMIDREIGVDAADAALGIGIEGIGFWTPRVPQQTHVPRKEKREITYDIGSFEAGEEFIGCSLLYTVKNKEYFVNFINDELFFE